MHLSEKIQLLRKQQGLSQEALADQLGVSRQAVSRWETGSALPDAGNLLQLSRLFGVTADSLLSDDCDPTPPVSAQPGGWLRRKKTAPGRRVPGRSRSAGQFRHLSSLPRHRRDGPPHLL